MRTNSNWLIVLCLSVVLPTRGQSASAGSPDPSRPNIVFFLFDDISYSQPTCYWADSEFNTPNIDRLAREGMRFTDAHSASAVCTPTRYGVLTGRYPVRIGQFRVLKTYSLPIIPMSRLTVASFLKKSGYHTACVGKWHLGMNWDKPGAEEGTPLDIGDKHSEGPNDLGFDYFCGYTHARSFRTVIEQDEVVAKVDAKESQPLMAKKAVNYITERAQSDAPFFLYFPVCPPHTPIAPADEFIGRGGIEEGKDARYSDWVHQGDHMLGKILEALEQTGQAGNTLVIATGDNGAEKRPYPPLRDSKRSIYEGGHRVPFVASWPGKIAERSLCDETVCLNDLFATCAEIVGVDLPDNAAEDSLSFLPCLLGESISPVREGVINQSGKGDLAIRKGKWKAVFRRNNDPELYDLDADLGETKDVASEQGEVVAHLKGLLKTYLDQGRSTPGSPQELEHAYSFVKSPSKTKTDSSGTTRSKNKRRRRSKQDSEKPSPLGKN